MCGVGAGVAGAAATNASLAIAAVSTVASVGMGFMAMQQQAAAAQANLNMQAKLAQQQQEQQRQSMKLSQDQNFQAQVLQQRQNQQAYNLQVDQANTQILNDWQRQNQAVTMERNQAAKRHELALRSFQKSKESANEQIKLSNEAANRTYTAEQSKLNEARKKAAFEQQSILAKSIGAKGSILATGRTGKSVGLLVKDVERQKGFAYAATDASKRSAREAAIVAMEGGWLKSQSETNQALSGMDMFPTDPFLPDYPDKPNFIGLGTNEQFAYT